MTQDQDPVSTQQVLNQTKEAMEKGQVQKARRLAWKAVKLAPDQEQPWLFLASLSSPQASIVYLRKALEINPQSQAARRGMRWAADRLRKLDAAARPRRDPLSLSFSRDQMVASKPAVLPWFVTVFVLLMVTLGWLWTPDFSFAFPSLQLTPQPTADTQDNLVKATLTYTPTLTPTATSTPSPTPTFTPTPTPQPTKTKKPPVNQKYRFPTDISANQRWIDLDLSKQRLYAYEGNKIVRKFVVSTGTWVTPTVTGTYRIYVKYRYAHMSGPGYYLPNVPYTMYFYKGYGIHGTYWHNNFGTPMSHGCVNMRTDESGWLFNWASVGTIVNIHY
ncbi:MAG: L,D-transpeptidase [Anaerolineales bacterium]|nr:L,D-transpeptidase [Anaerolineales bacterium]